MSASLIAATALTVSSITLAGGLWPFGDNDERSADLRIEDLQEPELELKRDLEIDNGSERAREQYRLLLEMGGVDPALKSEAMRRLGDLNLSAGEQGEMDGDLDGSRAFFAAAVTLYAALLEENPDYADRDRILYQLARANEATGEPNKALEILDRLVADHPDSPYFDEAQFRRGEILFFSKRFTEAETAYAAVVADGETSPFFEQSLYKLGWTRFKDAEYDTSLAAFMDLLDRRLVSPTGHLVAAEDLSRPDRELVDDTFRVMSITFSYLDGPASVEALLDRRGAAVYADQLFDNLGNLYIEQERFTDAAATFSSFVARQPTHSRAPALQVRVIEAHTEARFPALVLEAKQDYVELFGLYSPFWLDRNPAEEAEVVATLKESLTDLAAFDHAQAQQNNDTEAYRRAADWYQRYLDYFPDDPDSASRNFLLADIYYELERYDWASQEYQRTAYGYGEHERAAEAAYAGLLSARLHGQTLAPELQPEWQAAVVDQAIHFAIAFPAHSQANPVLVRVSEDLFAGKQQAAALVIAGEVVRRGSAAELQRTAWTITAHGNFERERYAYAEFAYRMLLQYPDTKTNSHAELNERVAAAIYRQAEQARSAGNTAVAVSEFLRVSTTAPDSPFVTNALFDASALLINTEQWVDAIDVLEQFRARFPGHVLQADVTQKLAVAYKESGQAQASAAEFERIAGQSSTEETELRREALWQAAELYAEAGSIEDQRRLYALIVNEFPNPFAEALEARVLLADLAAEANEPEARKHWLNDIISADARAGAQRTDRSRTLAAQATFELATPVRDHFRAVRLVAPLDESLKRKKQRMEYALTAYGAAAEYGVAEVTTAATFEIADLYYRLSQDLMASERPQDLNAEELEQYDILLEEQAFPFEEQAIDILVANTERTRDGVYDEWVRKSFTRLAELMPARYAKPERSERLVARID